MTFIVGLTGGIGSGKSTAAAFFAALGTPIIDTDLIAKALVEPETPFFSKIRERFGEAILQKNGEVNRAALREIIFNSLEDRKWLEALLHPAIALKVKQELSKINYPYCIMVIPLLAENLDAYQPLLDHILVVDASEAQQLSWSVTRDNCAKELIQKIMQIQATRAQRLKIADTVLQNDGSMAALQNKIKNLHQLFLVKAESLS